MNRLLPLMLVLVLSCTSGSSAGGGSVKITPPGETKWEAAPGMSSGMMTATQYGDPVAGPYQVLIKFPAGPVVQPHYHKVDEFAIVLSGTTILGTGEMIDDAKGKEVRAGGYLQIPAGVAHWAKAKSDAVVLRFAPGPREMTPCNPEKPAPNKASAPKVVQAQDVKWTEVPDLARGAMRAEAYGDSKTGPSIFLLRLPAGVTRPPHWHNADECVTVLSGTILFGQGEKLEEQKATTVSAGGTVVVPARAPHWLVTRGEATIAVLVNGPRDVVYGDKR